MAKIVIENVEEYVFEKLINKAQQSGRSIEEEVREILHKEVNQLRLGSSISQLFAENGLKEGEEIMEWRGHSIKVPDFEL